MKCIKQNIIVAKIINSIKINYLNSLIINILLVVVKLKKKRFFYGFNFEMLFKIILKYSMLNYSKYNI